MSGKFTLEIFAFRTDTSAADESAIVFSRATALLSGKKIGCAIEGDKINVDEPIALLVNSLSEVKGTVSLKIQVPDGCSLAIDDARFAVTGTSPDFTVTQIGDGISAGAYQVTFTVKKGSEIVHIFSEYINVFPGMRTDTWSGLEKDAAKEISQNMISSTVYVRGTGGWYETSDYNETAEAKDTNSGSFLSPLASIQKAIDKIIAINDGASEYTIYVDGTLDGKTATRLGTSGMATISAYKQDLNLTIRALSEKATLDGGARFTVDENDRTVTVTEEGIKKRIIYATSTSCKLNLSLEDLVIMGGNPGDHGGGIYFKATGGSTLYMKGCKISGNNATKDFNQYNGGGIYVTSSTCECKMEDCEISGNATYYTGGGIYVEYSTFTMESGTISDNTVRTNGGGIAVGSSSGNFIMNGGTIEKNKAKNGGGVEIYDGTFTMNGGTVSNNIASDKGGGFYPLNGTFEMNGGTFSGNKAANEGNGASIGITTKFKIKGDAKFADDDGIKLSYVYITGALTEEKVATITLPRYEADRKILYADGEPITLGICDKFTLTPASNGTEWKIVPNDDGTGGVLVSVPVLYVSSGGDDASGDGSKAKPFATLQKAVDTVIANNDTMSAYTIYVDGTLECGDSTYIGKNGMADFSALAQNLTLTIKALSSTATLDANQKTRVIYAKPASGALDLTLENLVITGGNASIGGGIYNNGTVTITSGTISSCTATYCGGGVYVDSGGTFKMSGTAKITGCTVTSTGTSDGGGGIYNEGGNVEIAGGTISGCTAGRSGGGICVHSNGILTMTGGSISGNGNTDMTYGGGVYVNGGTFTMTNGTISGNSAQMGAGVRLYQTFTKFDMSGGEITGNTATKYGGGVYVNQGTFTITGGIITGNIGSVGGKAGVQNNAVFNNNGGTVQSD